MEFSGASASAISPIAKKRSANWTNEEEIVLISETNDRDSILFGKMQGCGGQGKVSKLKENAWQSIADALNAKFVNEKRGVAEIKKKYYNIKQRGKEKLDQIKRPKTGGGPPPTYTAAESMFVAGMEGRPQIEGLQFGIDTDNSLMTTQIINDNVLEMTTETGSSDNNHGSKSKRSKFNKEIYDTTPLEKENLVLDNKRLKEEIKKLELEQVNLCLKNEILIMKKEQLAQSLFPSFSNEM